MYWLARWQSLQKLREGRRKGTRWAGHSLMAIVQFGENSVAWARPAGAPLVSSTPMFPE